MGLLASSRPDKRNRVRILFYGQSITAQGWVREVERHLRQKFPHADLVIENRALEGFPSQFLVKTAETDVYPYYPDLLVFHAYGAHDAYETLIRSVRERTAAEIMLQTDHVTREADFSEQTDPTRIPLAAAHWAEFMNHRWLPELKARYQTALCDPRSVWKEYLTHYKMAPSALLSDECHPNAHGDFLLAESIKDCLAYDAHTRSPAQAWVKTLTVGQGFDVGWQDGVLRVPFDGNRIDVIFAPHEEAQTASAVHPRYQVLIDGKAPSAWPELYAFTRALSPSAGKWPLLTQIGSEAPLRVERFKLEVRTVSREPERYAFRLFGSQTGFDGEGSSEERFVSNSKRVVLPPESWGVRYALELSGHEIPERFEIIWDVVMQGVDQFGLDFEPARHGSEASLTVAQGLPNGPHFLELRGPARAIHSLRVYRPPLTPEPR